jgi:hypothetical protein
VKEVKEEPWLLILGIGTGFTFDGSFVVGGSDEGE